MSGLWNLLNITFVAIVFVSLMLLLVIVNKIVKRMMASNHQKISIIFAFLVIAWLLLQAMLTISGFYVPIAQQPFRAIVALGPGLLLTITILFRVSGDSKLLEALPLDWLSYFHTIRLPIELVLLGLFLVGAIPRILTFEGWNFDILVGITAPLIGYLVFTINRWSYRIGLIWHWVSLALLMNIVILALLSIFFPIQEIGFDRENQALTVFPFIWLPTFIVPLVFINHILSIKKLMRVSRSMTPVQVS